MEELQCDSNDFPVTYLPDKLRTDDNLENQCEAKTTRDSSTSQHCYTEDTKSRISDMLDPICEYIVEDSNNIPVAYSPDQSRTDDNLEILCKAETVLDYLASEHCYTKDIKSKISNMLDQVLEIMQAESRQIFRPSLRCAV